MIGTLIWKDIKLNRAPMVFAAVVFIAPVLIYTVVALAHRNRESPADGWEAARAIWYLCIGAYGTTLFVPVYAAVAFARERRDRSAEFLGMFPVSRQKVVVSKLVASITLAVLPWIVFVPFLVVWLLLNENIILPGGHIFVRYKPTLDDCLVAAMWLTIGNLCSFGIAWLLSSLLRSETIAAGIAIATAIGLTLGTVAWIDGMNESSQVRAAMTMRALIVMFCAVGTGCLIAGTSIALRRRTP